METTLIPNLLETRFSNKWKECCPTLSYGKMVYSLLYIKRTWVYLLLSMECCSEFSNNRINIEFFLLQFQSLFVSSFSCDPSSNASFSFLFLRF
jgi:hypothetical protein